MVDQNPSLKDSQKLYFLKTNLSGEAASLISHLKIEDANYFPALQKLQSRYDKPLEIAHKHIERFFNQPAMTASSAQGLRSLHDVSDEVVRALQAMQREDRDTWLLFILIQKLDPETKQCWYQKVSDMPEVDVTLKAFLSFIDSRSFALQSAQPVKPRTVATYKPLMKPPYRGATTFVATNTPPNCDVCDKSAHPLYQCGRFIHMSSEERLSAIRAQMLCQNCLKKHPGETCRSGNCRKCGHLHHTLLHFALVPPLLPQSPSTSYVDSAGDGVVAQSLISALDSTANFDASNTLLATVSINVMDKQGRPHACRAVLDSASQFVAFELESALRFVNFLTRAGCGLKSLSSTNNESNHRAIVAGPASHPAISAVVSSK
nr:uncharacterized protein LOC109408686 [Aedes albopictus]